MAPTLVGRWGEPTSTIDWCERNYEVTHHIAEFWNTISNLVMIIPSAYGVYICWKDQMETRYLLSFLFLFLVGVGSWGFHMTLLYEMQLLDELPMVWGTCMLLFCLEGLVKPPKTSINFTLILILASYSLIVSWVYLIIRSPLFHEVAYAVLVFITISFNISLARSHQCSVKIFLMGVTLYALGFTLWNIDNIFCKHLTNLRIILPGTVRPLTQLHAWWHCLAGYASYLQLVLCCHARLRYLKIEYEVKYGLPGLFVCRKRKTTRTSPH